MISQKTGIHHYYSLDKVRDECGLWPKSAFLLSFKYTVVTAVQPGCVWLPSGATGELAK